ncbi:thermonuclease family protein [Jannaschia aquimarina]|uniref:TNase-like domain-containing protein n=1 Tax=Jannaschia aquimarina TaxID=935700 RepID=A0A0D1EFX6_9RHOB|nr:thermonuclease family protein [Jannaschia aquimarina]KIT16589.1 hypothetical protein jaqu_16840 [Jannaschia aquimarina]SNT41449.1 nuclease homologue [Jannaschia aquimarina]
MTFARILAVVWVATIALLAAFWDHRGTAAVEPVADIPLCRVGQPNTFDKTCIVDGDTIWLHGTNYRLKDFDTPEPRTNICGGFEEIDLARAATDRLHALLNSDSWTIETFGFDGTGQRTLATIRIAGEDVGDVLIREGLARRWPYGEEFWCS